MEEFNGWDFCRRGDTFVWEWNIGSDTPNALYGYSKTKKNPSSFETYKNLLKAAGSGKHGLNVVEDETFSHGSKKLEGHHDFGGTDFVRKSDSTPVKDQALIDAALEDDLKIIGPGYLRLMVQSHDSARHNTVYIMDYACPSPYPVEMWKHGMGLGFRGYNDGGIRISPSQQYTDALGGWYDENFAYTEMKRIVKHYASACSGGETYDEALPQKTDGENPISKIGKGENSGTNFQPVRKTRRR